MFGRNNLGEIASGKRLNRTLKHANHESQDTKTQKVMERQSVQADCEVTDNAHQNQGNCSELF